MTNMANIISETKKKVNPKIAKDIENLMKHHLERIVKSSDYYKLRTLSMDVDKTNIKVKKDVLRLLELFKLAARQKIEKKIQRIQSQENKDYGKQEIEQFLNRNKIKSKMIALIYGFIYGKCVMDIGMEDFKIITRNARTAKLHSLSITKFDRGSVNSLLKPKLKGMRNAILAITGNKNTTLDELDMVWESTLRNLPKNSKTSCAYKIDNVKNLQLNLLAVK